MATVAEPRKKMNEGNLEAALSKACHHLSPSTTFGMLLFAGDPEEILTYRFKIIREEISESLARIKQIRQIATEQGYADILAILDEVFPFGHDIDS